MTLNDALILSYVKRGIGYGYHILTHVRESRSDEWVDFSRAGLYKALDKLEKQGYVEKNVDRSGARPPKKVYSITLEGERALSAFLDSGFRFEYLEKNDFDAFLVTACAASPDASSIRGMIRKRIDAVKNHLDELSAGWPDDKDAYPVIVYALYKRRLDSLHQELDWLVWLEDIMSRFSGDILHRTWGEVRVL